MSSTVKVSNRNQITLPTRVRQQLGIKPGDRLAVDVQEGLLLLIPVPANYVDALAGCHREIWQGIDTDAYLRNERDSWEH